MKRTVSHCSILLIVAAGLAALSGCGPAGGSSTLITDRSADASSQWSEDLFSFALENLNHLEDNDCEEMLRSTEQRLVAMRQPKIALGIVPPNRLLASWPEPDMLRQVVGRLNQWVDTQAAPGDSQLDPMLATLPSTLRKLPMVKDLGQAHFTAYDGYMLMEAVWLRDASRSKWAGGTAADELQTARSLFDWTMRNIQTDYDGSDHVPQVPWETLFLGHGTTWERAWTYILLLRQRGIDSLVLALPDPAASTAKSGKETLKPWCVGVLIGDKQKRLYLFDPQLGLPVPGPGGIGEDRSGRLDIQPAALDEVAADPKLLDRLAVAADSPYWARKADLKRAVALLEASPLYLSPRAKRIEARLTGQQRLVLNAEPSRQAARVKAAGVGDVRLWELPYATLQLRLALEPAAVMQRLLAYEPFMTSPGSPLYKGRILHLKGRFFEEKEAVACYQRARPRNDAVAEEMPQIAKEGFNLLCQRRKADSGTVTAADEKILKQLAAWHAQQVVEAIIQGKLAASYWLGLIEYEQGELAAAMDYFKVRTLQFGPSVFWAKGAHYNIARTLEASGQRHKAIETYETSLLLRNDEGCQVRARWLRELDGAKTGNPEEKKADEKKKEEKKTDEKKTDAKPLKDGKR